MDMYLEREALRLEGIFKSQIQSTSFIPTQPLLAPPVPEVPRAESPQFMESPMEPSSPIHPPIEYLDDSPWIDELPPLYVRETEDLQPLHMDTPPPILPVRRSKRTPVPIDESPAFTASPPQAVLKSTIPLLKLKTVPKQPVIHKQAVIPKEPVPNPNKFAHMDWEELNTHLHGKYPNSRPGVLCLKSFKTVSAIEDYDDLVEIQKKNIPDLVLVKTWIKKLYDAILECGSVSTSDSEKYDSVEDDM